MTAVMKFFEKKNVKIAVMVINLLLIVGLVFYIIFMHAGSGRSSKAPGVTAEEYTEEQLNQALSQANDSMMSIYSNLIPGSSAEFSDGNTMTFGSEGSYSGYFDESNPSITGTYVVTTSDDTNFLANVNIYNGNSSNYVQYKLMYDENNDFMLYYPENGTKIRLTY